MPRLASLKACRKLRLVHHAHPRLAQRPRGHTVSGHERARERAVVHEPVAARRTLRFQHGQRAAPLPHQLRRFGGPGQKRVRGIAPVRVHHAQSTLGGDDLARRARHGQPSERLRAHAHKFVRRAQPQHGLARPRLPVEAARLAQQTRAHGYRHGSSSFRR